MSYVRTGLLAAILSWVLQVSSFAQSTNETIEITTYYPAPYGSYAELTTTNNTYLATKGGNVGIGTTAPGAKLEVSGTIRTIGFRMPTGAADKYVLTSNGSGVGTWEAAGGIRGYEVVNSGTCSNCHSARVSCSSGKKVLGGGCMVISWELLSSYPDTDSSWVCSRNGGLAGETTAYAICANI